MPLWNIDHLYNNLIRNDYIDDEGMLTDTFREDKKNGTVKVADKVKDFSEAIISILDMVYDAKKLMPEDDRKSNVTATLDERKTEMKEFKDIYNEF